MSSNQTAEDTPSNTPKTHAFIHIPKNAGTSIREALHGNPSIQYFGHDVRQEDVAHLKKIYVVRDPADRFASAFFYLKNHKCSQAENKVFANPNELLEALASLDPRALRMMRLSDEIHYVDGKPILTDWVFAQQSRWIWDPHYLMDFDYLDFGLWKWLPDFELPHLNRSQHEPFDYSLDSLKFLKLLYKQDYKLYDKASLDI
jgi:hypothetical protein